MNRRDALARFWQYVEAPSDGKCWTWLGCSNRQGYGVFRMAGRKMLRAHRLMWELHSRQEIPAGKMVLHSCDNPACVNPEHLRIGTAADNMRDCISRRRHVKARQTHCVHGHPFDERNTIWRARGHRGCRTCKRIQERKQPHS